MNIHKVNIPGLLARNNRDYERFIIFHLEKDAVRELVLERCPGTKLNLSDVYWFCKYHGTGTDMVQYVFKLERRLACRIVRLVRGWIDGGYVPVRKPSWWKGESNEQRQMV